MLVPTCNCSDMRGGSGIDSSVVTVFCSGLIWWSFFFFFWGGGGGGGGGTV